MNRRLLLLAALALTGCASTTASSPPPPPVLPELEPLYSAVAGRDGLTIQASSNGCTTKADFAFYLERRGEAVTVSFARRRIDTCKSFAMGKAQLSFSWAELGVPPRTPVFLLNPLVAWTGPGG
jgi:hypothetical protein